MAQRNDSAGAPSGSARQPKKRARRSARAQSSSSRPDYPVVGIGASAGGLEALEEFFRHAPTDSGIAFVVIMHQRPGHRSLLPELLGKCTDMHVIMAGEGTRVEPNQVYIGPPGEYVAILHGTLSLMGAAATEDVRLPIDYFFRSLAQDLGPRAIGVILSGTGTDGTLGLTAIKGEAGMAMVQDMESARYGGMPGSAIAAGVADYVLPPGDMPGRLVAYVHGVSVMEPTVSAGAEALATWLQKVFVLLRTRTGHDFSAYKPSTIRRRIERRINVHQIETMAHYVRYLQENPNEVDLLFKELLINVSSFFRDVEAFAALAHDGLKPLFESRVHADELRVWVPGCANGEEAYSIAILFRECMEDLGRKAAVQIFATDLDGDAIETARAGRYPEGVAADMSPERLRRFFVREDGVYCIKKEIREMVVFAEQDLIKDPPFTKLDLISCRNLLIYLKSDVQQRLLPVFYYALRPGGLLFLGPSETIGTATELFTAVDRKWRIFRRKEPVGGAHLPMPAVMQRFGEEGNAARPAAEGPKDRREARIVAHLLRQFVPPTVIVDAQGDIVYIHGRTGAWLEPASGRPRLNILDMAREGLRIDLASVLRQAGRQDAEIVHQGVRVKSNGDWTLVDLSVRKITEPEAIRGLYLVALSPSATPAKTAAARVTGRAGTRIEEMERELQYTKENLQTTIEELETSNEELKSTNEELQSTNEELQSTNEELETSKEELQSLNEELSTVNGELQSKVDEFSEANNDMQNLLNSMEIATVFLDGRLHVRRFTTRTQHIVRLIGTDVGRPIGDLALNLEYSSLVDDARQVLETLVPKEAEVRTRDGSWYFMRIMPYRTVENAIDGLVITFVNLERLRQVEIDLEASEHARVLFESIVQTVREPLVVLDEELRVIVANQAFYGAFHVDADITVGRCIYELGKHQWDVPRLRQALEAILTENQTFNDFEVNHVFPGIGRRSMLLNGRRVQQKQGQPGLVLLAIEDVTDRVKHA